MQEIAKQSARLRSMASLGPKFGAPGRAYYDRKVALAV
jgi:hypothetical protein